MAADLWEEGEEERERGSGGNIPLRGYIKPHIVRGLDDWVGDNGFYNPLLVS